MNHHIPNRFRIAVVSPLAVMVAALCLGTGSLLAQNAIEVGDNQHALVRIKAGAFTMGKDSSGVLLKSVLNFEADNGFGEGPAHRVTITKDFFIGKYKITCAEYCVFLNNTEKAEVSISLNPTCRIEKHEGKYRPREGGERLAVNTVPWKGAVAFCQWLSRRTGRVVRLPTEAEWEFAARGQESRTFPWGNGDVDGEWEKEYRNLKKYPHPWSGEPVDAFPKNSTPEGVVGMASFTGEWCSDYYGIRHLTMNVVDPQGPRLEDLPVPTGNPLLAPVTGEYRVLRRTWRGGHVTQREPGDSAGDGGVYGFRIVVEIPAE